MEARFGYFGKDRNSTKRPDDDWGDLITNINYKEPTSMNHPVLLVQSSLKYNYVKIVGKYYFVDDIVHVNSTLSEYHCSIDVLASYKTLIGSSTQYVTRAQNRHDPYVVDGKFPIKSKKTSQRSILSTLHSAMYDTVGGGYYIVGVFGKGQVASGGVNYYCMLPGQFNNFCQGIFDIYNYSISNDEVSYNLQKVLMNPMQYIAYCKWFPLVEKPSGTIVSTINVGYWNISIASAFLLNTNARQVSFASGVTLPLHPKTSLCGNYMNVSPFTRRTLYCYMFGSIPIDCSYFVDSDNINLHVSIKVDTFTGDGILSLSDDNGITIEQRTAKMGVDVQIAQVRGGILSNALTAFGSLGETFGQIAGESYKAGSIIGAGAGIVTAIGASGQKVTSYGAQGTIVGYTSPAVLVSEFFDVVMYDNTKFGHAYCQVSRIDNLGGGYCEVQNPHIDIACTSEELTKIEEYMEKGFYYE